MNPTFDRRPSIVGPFVVALLLAAVSGCATGDESSGRPTTSDDTSAASSTVSSTTAADPSNDTPDAADTARVPQAGNCLVPMTGPIARNNQLPATIDCAEPHGGEVISIHELGDDPSAIYPALRGGLVGADDALKDCGGTDGNGGEFGEFVGDNQLDLSSLEGGSAPTAAWAVSGVEVAVFVPDPAQWAVGQRWLACAAVLNNRSDSPSSYEGSAEGVRTDLGSLPPQFAWCKDQRSTGEASDFSAVSCVGPHNYEQIASFRAAAAEASFPGADALDELGGQLCADLGSLATDGRSDDLPDGYGMSWTYPLEPDWANGERVVRCYVATLNGLSSGSVGSGTETADN